MNRYFNVNAVIDDIEIGDILPNNKNLVLEKIYKTWVHNGRKYSYCKVKNTNVYINKQRNVNGHLR